MRGILMNRAGITESATYLHVFCSKNQSSLYPDVRLPQEAVREAYKEEGYSSFWNFRVF